MSVPLPVLQVQEIDWEIQKSYLSRPEVGETQRPRPPWALEDINKKASSLS